jgi:DNA-directed RNA polymerase subunit M/transcription elongation factor TFIIS
MKQDNLKGKFYGNVVRSVVILLVLILFLALVPQAIMLQNQTVFTNSINKIKVTGVDVATVLISFGIMGVLLYFAYTTETQLPRINKGTKYAWLGLIISSVVHIVVIFIAYMYLLEFVTDRFGKVNQVFNAISLILLCVPLYRGGSALFKTIDLFTKDVERAFGAPNQMLKCQKCDMENDPNVKFCANCGNKLQAPVEIQKTIACNQCGKENDASAKFCDDCGNKLAHTQQPVICPHCGAENGGNVKFCNKCGTGLVSSAP